MIAVLTVVTDPLWPEKCTYVQAHRLQLYIQHQKVQKPLIECPSLRIPLAEDSVNLQVGFNYFKTTIICLALQINSKQVTFQQPQTPSPKLKEAAQVFKLIKLH